MLVFALGTKLLPWLCASPILPSRAITYSHKGLMLIARGALPGGPRNNTQLSKDTSGQTQQPKDVGLPSCLTHPYTCTVVHRRACNSNRIGNMPQSKNEILPQVNDPPISTSVQISVIPLNILPA